MEDKPEDMAPLMLRLSPSKDWMVTFYCVNCKTCHHMLLLKQRVHYKAVLIENTKAHKDVVKPFGSYKNIAGSPDDKVLDDIIDTFGPEEDDDDEDGDEDSDE